MFLYNIMSSIFQSIRNQSLRNQNFRENRNVNLKQDNAYNESMKRVFHLEKPKKWNYDMTSTKIIFDGNANPTLAQVIDKTEKGEYLEKVLTTLREQRDKAQRDEQARLDAALLAQAQAQAQADADAEAERLRLETQAEADRLERERVEAEARAKAEEDAKAKTEEAKTEEAKKEEVKDTIKTTPVIRRRLADAVASHAKMVMEAEKLKTPNQKVYSSKDSNPLRVISDTTQFYTPVIDANETINYPSSTKATSLLHDLQQEDSDVEDDEDEAAAKEGEKSANGEIAEVLETETFTVSKLNKLVKLIDKATTTREAKMQIMQYLSKNKEKYEKAISAYNFRVQDSPLTSRKYNGENLMTALRSITE